MKKLDIKLGQIVLGAIAYYALKGIARELSPKTYVINFNRVAKEGDNKDE